MSSPSASVPQYPFVPLNEDVPMASGDKVARRESGESSICQDFPFDPSASPSRPASAAPKADPTTSELPPVPLPRKGGQDLPRPSSRYRSWNEAKKTSASPLVSKAALGGLVGGSVLTALILVPPKEELVERLVRDGAHERVQAIVVSAPPVEATQPPPPSAPEIAIAALSSPDSVAALEGEANDHEIFQAIRGSHEASELYALYQQNAVQSSPALRQSLLRALGDAALAQNDPALAAKVYADFLTEHKDASPDTVQQMVRSWRLANKPAQALACLDVWIKKREAAGEAVEESIYSDRISLQRELNRPADALDSLMSRIAREEKTGRGTIDPQTLDLAIQTAGYVNRQGDLKPIVTRWLDKHPLGQATWEEVRNAVKGISGSKSSLLQNKEKFVELARQCAQWCEWGSEPATAFELWRKLAVMGDADAFERCAALYQGLFLMEPYRQLVEALVPQAQNPQLELELAQMNGIAGRYDEAIPGYKSWLESHPEDAKSWIELGALYEEQLQIEPALVAYKKALEVQPDDLAGRKKIASIYIDLHRVDEAHAVYRAFKADDHDATTLENYALLSESLGHYQDLRRALMMRLDLLKTPHTNDFTEIARTCELTGDHDLRLKVLRRGLAALPQSKVLRIDLATALREADQLTEAFALLESPSLRRDIQAISMMIEIAALTEDSARALKFLGNRIEDEFALADDTKLDLAHLYLLEDRTQQAQTLINQVPQGPATWPSLANASFRLGDYAQAEAFQRKHLAQANVQDPEDWMFLGDILSGAGKASAAEQAYDKALNLMRQKVPTPASAPKKSNQQRRPGQNASIEVETATQATTVSFRRALPVDAQQPISQELNPSTAR